MAACNAHYYATRDPLGPAGDFVTAPEISQMFGELVGLWCADLWDRAGRPATAWVELGPGRGTLAADALRAMAKAGFAPDVHFVETSPVLRARQAERVAGAVWHETVATLPDDRALIVVANEFFDALPVRQTIGGVVRRVTIDGDGFAAVPGTGEIVESCPAALAVMAVLAQRIERQGGALLAIDYGHRESAIGETLQAVRGHAAADPFVAPGETDLTAHVDFAALAAAARPLVASRVVDQGEWLLALGLAQRAAALARRAPERAQEIAVAYRRLTSADAMGRLFKVLALTAPGWPAGAGL